MKKNFAKLDVIKKLSAELSKAELSKVKGGRRIKTSVTVCYIVLDAY
jgi:hypothetical protein